MLFICFFLFSDSSRNFLELVFEDHQASQRLKVSDLPSNEHITKLIYLLVFFLPLKGLSHKREFQIILINHCRRFHQTWFHSLTFVWVQTSPKGRETLGVLAGKCLCTMVISINNKLLLALHTVSSTAWGSYRHFFKFPSWLKIKVYYYILHSAPVRKKKKNSLCSNKFEIYKKGTYLFRHVHLPKCSPLQGKHLLMN